MNILIGNTRVNRKSAGVEYIWRENEITTARWDEIEIIGREHHLNMQNPRIYARPQTSPIYNHFQHCHLHFLFYAVSHQDIADHVIPQIFYPWLS